VQNQEWDKYEVSEEIYLKKDKIKDGAEGYARLKDDEYKMLTGAERAEYKSIQVGGR
jgi:hypothetical protein